MSLGLPIEQPPEDDNQSLTEWLARMMVLISGEFERGVQLDPIGELPEKVQEGMVRYFDVVIDPEIPEPGPYIYFEGEWVSLLGVGDIVLERIAPEDAGTYPYQAGGIYWLPEADPYIPWEGPYFYDGTHFRPLVPTSEMYTDTSPWQPNNRVGEMRYFTAGVDGEPAGPYYYNGSEWKPMFFYEGLLPEARCPTT